MSAGGRYRFLFTPLRLGPVVVRNRIVFSAHLTNYAEDGLPAPQHAAYYGARAAGGAGLIITEEHSTHPTDWPYEKLIHGFHRSGSSRVSTDHRRRAPLRHADLRPDQPQRRPGLGHVQPPADLGALARGRPALSRGAKGRRPRRDQEIVDGYARVAAHCAEGGFDGIELQCSHSSIVRGFLSPATNTRTDDYGGSLENRARLLHEIVAAVRQSIGPDLVLGVRLCGDELIEGGTTIEDAVAVARAVERAGQVDYINTSIGVATATLYMIEASMQVPPGYALWISSSPSEKRSTLPVIGVGRFKDPLQADRALSEGHADLIGVVRGQIADADFANKARAGDSAAIRNCLSCNQECVGRMGLNRWLGCIENPSTGREAVVVTRRARTPRSGPGRRRRGRRTPDSHRRGAVADTESTSTRHTTCRGARSGWPHWCPAEPSSRDLTRNQVSEAKRLGVTLHLETRVDAEVVRTTRPDVVVVATGAVPERPLVGWGSRAGGRRA